MAATVPTRRNSAGEVTIAGTISIDPIGKTLPVGAIDLGNETCAIAVSGTFTPSGTQNVAITGPLGAQTAAASVATVIGGTTPNGNTTSATSAPTGGPNTITAGAISIEFILSSDFTGTINGVAFNNTGTNAVGVYRLDAPPWKPLSALTYTITAGTVILTVQT
jgi:hypothetical protein